MIDGQISDGFMVGIVDGWINGWMNGWLRVWVDGQMDGQINAWCMDDALMQVLICRWKHEEMNRDR